MLNSGQVHTCHLPIQRWNWYLRENKTFNKILLGSNRNKMLVPYKNWAGAIAGLTGFCQTLYNSDSIFGVPTGQEI